MRASSSYCDHPTAITTRFQEQKLSPITFDTADEYLAPENLLGMVNAGLIQATAVYS